MFFDFTSKDFWCGFIRKFGDVSERVGLDEIGQVSRFELVETFVEFLEESDSSVAEFKFSGNISV